MTPAEQFIHSEVPQSARLYFPSAMRDAYKIVRQIIRENRWLQTQTVVAGHLKAWAADFAISQLVEGGKWPARKIEWAKFPTGSGTYLRVFTDNAFVTISQLSVPWEQPRHASFRENAKFNNQPFLFPEMQPEPIEDMPHLILGHGHGDLHFVQVGMPHPEHPLTWLARTNNILHELHDASSTLAQAEGIGAEAEPTIKADLLKRLTDHGG